MHNEISSESRTGIDPRRAAGANTPLRNKHQSMGIWMSETLLSRPEKIEIATRQLAQAGYGVVRLFLRGTNFSHRSARVVDAVRRSVAVAHSQNMRAVLDCEPHSDPLMHDMGNLFPEAAAVHVVRAQAQVVDGHFSLHIPAPPASSYRPDFLGVEAAFIQQDGSIRKLDPFDYQHRVVVESYENGFITDTSVYTEGRPARMWPHTHIDGRLKDVRDGALIVYARFCATRSIDFWAEGTRKYYDMLLECYRGIPLDGVGWDEPATDGDWNRYLYGNATAAAFERLNGYSLTDKWYLLDEPGVSPEAAGVRMDYYRTLNEGLFDAQRHTIAKAREIFGPNLLLGTHHTWQGEGGINDYRAGAVDYFRLHDNMDAGYTDGWWWDFKSICYTYTLGASLGRLTPSGEAEANTWDMKPTNSRVAYYARLMTLLDIVWFNIWYGESGDTQIYPADYTWKTTVREMNRNREGQRRIGKARPVADIAILHGWETVCGVNHSGIASAHKAFCLNTSELLVDRSVAFDWIDTRLLADSRIESGRLINALGSYSILVMPYASILPRRAWEICRDFANAGGKVVFVGTPVEMDMQGHCLRAEFADLIGMPQLPLDRYLGRIYSACTLPLNRPEKLDLCYPLDGERDRVLISVEDEPHAIRNNAGNVYYLSDLDPRQRLLAIIEPWLSREVTCYSDSIQWRLFKDSDRTLLVCISRQDRHLQGLIRWAGREVEFVSGTIAFLELRNGELNVSGEGLNHRITKL